MSSEGPAGAPGSGRAAQPQTEQALREQLRDVQGGGLTEDEREKACRTLKRMRRDGHDIECTSNMIQLHAALRRCAAPGARVLPTTLQSWKRRVYHELKVSRKFWVVPTSMALPADARPYVVDPCAVGLPANMDLQDVRGAVPSSAVNLTPKTPAHSHHREGNVEIWVCG